MIALSRWLHTESQFQSILLYSASLTSIIAHTKNINYNKMENLLTFFKLFLFLLLLLFDIDVWR